MMAKTPSESRIETRQLVMPNHINPIGTIFGGIVMAWIDTAASLAAERHCGRPAVTAHVSDISFKAPLSVGDHCYITASLQAVGRTSMLVGVDVYAENPKRGLKHQTTKAHLVFVALGNDLRPTSVPPLRPKTDGEKKSYVQGQSILSALKKKK